MHLNGRIISDPEDIQADAVKLLRFVSLYCKNNHRDREKSHFSFQHPRVHVSLEGKTQLCENCERLLRHSIVMRALCPLDPKPKCRKCPQNCYRPDFRDEMERVMRYSGPRSLFIKP